MSDHKDVQFAALEQAARTFGSSVIEPGAEAWESAGALPREYFLQAGEAGLCGLLVPAAQGGQALSMQAFATLLEILAGHCLSATFALVVHNNLAAAIARRGTDAQRADYLPDMLAGRRIGAFLLTEPGAGSDAASIATAASRGSDGSWTLNGAKAWVTNGVNADILSIYTRTEPVNDSAPARDIAAFLVDTTNPGVNRHPPYRLLGGHALGACEFSFDECTVTDNQLMLPAGEGFRAAMAGIDLARISVAAMCCGMMQRALSEAVRYSGQRHAFGRRLRDFQGVSFALADCASDLAAARALVSAAAAALDAGEPSTLLAAHAKKFASRAAFQRIGDCMQTMGAVGLSRDYPLARLLEGAKITQYIDGATDILNVVIARELDAAGRNGQASA